MLIGVIGIVFGTQMVWVYQIAAVAIFYAMMESPIVKAMEIGAMIPYMFGMAFLIGMIIGDISWFIQIVHETMDWTMGNPFVAK